MKINALLMKILLMKINKYLYENYCVLFMKINVSRVT